MANDKVFASDITRSLNKLNNNLYDLLSINPVTPLPIKATDNLSCDFVPKTDKYFIPKRKLRFKVKTVRDIRNSLEKDVYGSLATEIEKQQQLLLRKIRGGSSKDEKTKLLAKNMFKSEKPISRMAWQMLININPENYAHASQFVLWNGQHIQVNGSRGGKSKFIYNYDLAERRASLLQRQELKNNNLITKKDLLKQSLHVKFKPGPLSRKKQLDVSYQKYNVGNIELTALPKPGLDILPEYGKVIDTSIANFLQNLRDVSGIISEKWAEFAVSALGTYDNGHAIQTNKDCCITFDLNYKYNQRQLLMRYDDDFLKRKKPKSPTIYPENEDTTFQEVQKMLNEILISVEINLMQNTMYTGEDSPREPDVIDMTNRLDSQPKDKVKRRGQLELHRLDVTVIRLFDKHEKIQNGGCLNSFCRLGCICHSLLSSFHLKNHCGRVECMFECKCVFNKYHLRNYFDEDFIPGLVSLDKEKSAKLSKEEQKFHQTVIVSGEKSILLKSQKRNWKAPEKYADFYSNMCLKTKKDMKQILSVVEIKLPCGNIEPWCMIHNLYKCFCKGKFTERLSNIAATNDITIKDNESNNNINSSELPRVNNLGECVNLSNSESMSKLILRPRTHPAVNIENNTDKNKSGDETNVVNLRYQGCARVRFFRKRKYSDAFYSNTNKKIADLEQNDSGLRKRLNEILKIDKNGDITPNKDSTVLPTIDLSLSPVHNKTTQELNEITDEVPSSKRSAFAKFTSDVMTTQCDSSKDDHLNNKLKSWLEQSLKMYRQRFGKGFIKKSLDPPKAGKIALYPWDFIISRYREKKNLFLVTNQKPFRIFMAVDSKNSMFNNCVNINSIENLDMYPVSVKNIITNEVDHLKDQLCILRGLHICWELVGSVKKVCDRKNSESDMDPNEQTSDIETLSPQSHTTVYPLSYSPTTPTTPATDASVSVTLNQNSTEQSKWFIMTIENDFSEIQFYKKGFFVKYDSIIKAINVARASEKTVRLSSQKCNEGNSDLQFGIYAIPNANEYCVFIGPYEKNEPLGIETIKTTLYKGKMKTRGVWITTNKVDNLQVIDNPLSFMSQVNLEQGQILDETLQHEEHAIPCVDNKSLDTVKEKNKVIKLVKPIKIAKTNHFYHLTPFGILKPISISPEKQLSITPSILQKRSVDFDQDNQIYPPTSPLLCRSLMPQANENNKYLCIEESQKETTKRPIAEIAPQVKVAKDSSEANNTQRNSHRKFEGGMFVLKPEEINSRSLVDKISFPPSPIINNSNTLSIEENNEIDMDIESFLANSVECSAPNTDVYVISDDEDYCSAETSNKNLWNDVWIICKNVLNIGWISGRQDAKNNLSFEFPGFKFTEFYPEEEAFIKITQVLARKIYVPENVDLSWCVVEEREEFEKLKLNKLKQEDLDPDYVLTNNGFVHKSLVVGRTNKNIRTYSKNASKRKSDISSHVMKNTNIEIAKSEIRELEAESNALLEEGELLLSETVQKQGEFSNSFAKMSNDQRQEVSDRLRSIISNSTSS